LKPAPIEAETSSYARCSLRGRRAHRGAMALLRHDRRVSSGGRCATFGRYIVILLLARGSEAADDEESMAQQPGDDSIALMESGLDLVFNVGGKRTDVPRLDATDFHTAADATAIVCDNEEHRCYVPDSRFHLCPIAATTKPPWCSDRMTLSAVTPLPATAGGSRRMTAGIRRSCGGRWSIFCRLSGTALRTSASGARSH